MILCHHGIKGQKWGVRRYQNKDGSLTKAGKERLTYRNNIIRNDPYSDDVNKIVNSLSDKEKKLLGASLNEDWRIKDSEHYYEALSHAKISMLQAGKDLVMNLMGLGLLPKIEKITVCGKEETIEYCYVFEEFRFEHNVIKELLGIDAADFQSLTEEQFDQMREKQDARWRKQNDLINGDFGDGFVSFKGLTHLG